ncbi:MAG TPA: thiamine phosphate synthase [Pyrinomonadaceae bacterium]|nr:thiamine phosphate synthase [Pyrinomonadaceae bacterium]
MPFSLSRPILYLITRGATSEATTAASPEFAQILDQVSAATSAGIDLIQIREKQLTAGVLFDLVGQAVKRTRGTATRVLVNDRADIAAGAGADGVHLTTQSLSAATVRAIFGRHFVIGVSTHALNEALLARDGGADFAVFGPVFQTKSKELFGEPQGLETLSQVAATLSGFPIIALGGVSAANAGDCLAAGAQGIAGIGLFAETANFDSVCSMIRRSERSAHHEV